MFEHEGGTLARVPATGGDLTELTVTEGTFTDVLPDGWTAPHSGGTGNISFDCAEVRALGVEALTMTPLLSSAYGAQYLATGHLLFARAGALIAVPCDTENLAVTDAEVGGASGRCRGIPVCHGSRGDLRHRDACVRGGTGPCVWKVARLDRRGQRTVLDMPERVYGVLDVSPRGSDRRRDTRRRSLFVALEPSV